MASMKNFAKLCALLASALTLTPQLASAAAVSWNGAAGDKLWSTAGNWSAKPTSADDVAFGNADTNTATSGPTGVSNSIVDASFTSAIKSLRITNNAGFHNIRLTNNLAINGTTAVDSLFVGTGLLGPNYNQTVYATLTGPGALTLTNTSGYFRICQGTNAAGGSTTARATLDLSGLDTFSARVAGFYVAVSADSTASAIWNRPCAYVLLARTNYITCTTHLLSEAFNNNGAQSQERLGQVNYFNVDTFEVGERKGTALFNFNTGWTNPTVRFRNAAGTGRSTWYIGTDNGATGSGATAATLDLSAGTVDALVGTAYVGQSQAYATSTETGDGVGALTFSAGTIDVDNLEVGYQIGDGTLGGQSTGKGTITVRTNGLLKVNNDLRMTRQLPPYTTSTLDQCGAVLIINNGTVTVGGNIVDGGGTNNITITNNGVLNMQPAGDLTPGSITVKSVILGAGSLTNWNTLTTTNITLRAPATEFAVYPGQTLVPSAVGVAGTLQVNGSLNLTNATLKYDLGDASATYDQIIVTNNLTLNGTSTVDVNAIGTLTPSGTYTLMTYAGALVGAASNLALSGAIVTSRYNPVLDTSTVGQVNLLLTGSAANLTWSGGVNGNAWNVQDTVNFNYDPVGGTNTEKFYSLDNVTFDYTSANTSVNLAGTLLPSAVSVSALDYTFGGSGKISGAASLTLSSGSLTLLTTNDYTGVTTVNGGTLQVGNGTTADGGLSASPIVNYSTLILNPASTQYVGGAISGYGTFTKQGPGATCLAGANSFGNDFVINAGTVVAGSSSAFGSAAGITTINSGATLDIAGQRLDGETFQVAGPGVGGKGAIVNNGAGQLNAFATVIMTGDTTFGGTGGRLDINNPTGVAGGLLSNPSGAKLTKLGVNALSLFNNTATWDTALGDIDIQEGILRVQYATTLGDTTKTITVRSNATLQLDNQTTGNTMIKVLSLDNGACVFATRSGANNYFGGPITLNGTNIFDSISGATLVLTNTIGGTGSLLKGIGSHANSPEGASTGTGTLILMANNTFTGDFRVQTGTAILTNNASVNGAANIVMAGGTLNAGLRTDGTLTLAAGQTFKGNGTLTGKLSSPANTTVSPGATTTAATLTLNGNATLRGTTMMDITKTNTTRATDRLAVTGALDLGGALNVNFSGNTNLAAGDSFTLFTATTGYANSFTSTNLPVLPAGLGWSNYVATTSWIIQVIATEPPSPPTLTNFFNGSSLMLSWDSAYSTYVLEGETNPVSIGITTNSADWHLVPGVSGNQISIPVDPVNGSVFFRLRR